MTNRKADKIKRFIFLNLLHFFTFSVFLLLLPPLGLSTASEQQEKEYREIKGPHVSEPVPAGEFEGDVRNLPEAEKWKPGDPIKEIPRRVYPRKKSDIDNKKDTEQDTQKIRDRKRSCD
jgi:hypothetical protein